MVLFFYMQVVSLMFQNVNLLRKMAVHNAGCGLAYFSGGHRNDYNYYNFVAPLRNFHIGLQFDTVDYKTPIRTC